MRQKNLAEPKGLIRIIKKESDQVHAEVRGGTNWKQRQKIYGRSMRQ